MVALADVPTVADISNRLATIQQALKILSNGGTIVSVTVASPISATGGVVTLPVPVTPEPGVDVTSAFSVLGSILAATATALQAELAALGVTT